jgi:hypothetical protein
VRYAERAVAATPATNAELLDTLAAAYAEAGRFDAAIATAERARAAAAPAAAARIDARLALYRAHHPYRMP